MAPVVMKATGEATPAAAALSKRPGTFWEIKSVVKNPRNRAFFFMKKFSNFFLFFLHFRFDYVDGETNREGHEAGHGREECSHPRHEQDQWRRETRLRRRQSDAQWRLTPIASYWETVSRWGNFFCPHIDSMSRDEVVNLFESNHGSLIDWLIDHLIQQCIVWLIDWLIDQSPNTAVYRLIDWLIGRLFVLLIDWLMVDCLIEWM